MKLFVIRTVFSAICIYGTSNVIAQSIKSCPQPTYPKLAKRLSQEGTVSVALAIDPKGKLLATEISRSSGFDLLDEAALVLARECTFSPRIIDGRAVESVVIMPVTFVSTETKNDPEMLKKVREQQFARTGFYHDTPNPEVREIMEANLREAGKIREKQEQEQAQKEAQHQAWLLTAAGEKYLADQAIKEKKEKSEREQAAKQEEERAAERKRQDDDRAKKTAEAAALQRAAIAKLKVNGVGLGQTGKLPCQAKASTYENTFSGQPTMVLFSCNYGVSGDHNEIIFASDKKTVIRVNRKQFLTVADPSARDIVEKAVEFFGTPAKVDLNNWFAIYRDGYTVS